VIGREDLIGDERYASPAERTKRRGEVDALIAEWTRQHDKHTAMRLIGGATIPSGAVLDTRELADEPTFRERKIRQTMEHPAVGDYVMSGWPVRFGDAPPKVGPAPLLGEHSGDVLADWLKLDGATLAELRAAKVIAEPALGPAKAIA
jgi:formyl-CoA transferase